MAKASEIKKLPAAANPPQRTSLIQKMAARYTIDPEKLLSILSATAFKQQDGKPAPTNEQMAALLVVADQYGLNPFTREIFAFADSRAGIVPVVGVDGWSRIINDHPKSDGFDFRESEEKVKPTDGKECPVSMEVVIYRKDRAHPIVVREYIDEVYQGKRGNFNGPWQTHTKRMFRHKVLIQGARIAYGFGGIYDEDEAQRIVDMGEAQVIERTPMQAPKPKPAPAEAETEAPLDANLDETLNDGMVAFLKSQLEQAALTDAELFTALGAKDWSDLKVKDIERAIQWIKNPTD